ncbi:MAG: hypothetical protein AAGK78_06285 [Planctomycetota bacterium]
MPRCLLHDPIDHRVSVASLDAPTPGDGQLVVHIEYSAISPGTELRGLAGKQVNQPTRPYVGGYSAAGRVVEGGHGFDAGDAVFVSGNDHTSPHDRMWGGHVSHAVVDSGDLVRIPEGVPMHVAAMGKMLAIGHHGTRLVDRLHERRALVVGLGIIGQAAARSLSAQGVSMLAVDRSVQRVSDLALAEVPAEVAGDLTAQCKDHLGGAPDLIVDATGVPQVTTALMPLFRSAPWGELLSPLAYYVIQGSYPADIVIDYDAAFRVEASIVVARDCGRADLEQVFQLLASGDMSTANLAPDPIHPADAPALYDALAEPATAPLTGIIDWRDD